MAYESQASRTVKDNPKGLPDASKEVEKGVPDGAVFQLEDDSGRRFRLRHPRTVPAEWAEIVKRERKSS